MLKLHDYLPSQNGYKVRMLLAHLGVSYEHVPVAIFRGESRSAEFLVLKGAQETLSRFHPVVLIEVVDRQLQSMGSSSKEVYEFFRSHGYTAQTSFEDNVEFVPRIVP